MTTLDGYEQPGIALAREKEVGRVSLIRWQA